MPFTKLKLTTFGTTLETKWKQGKGVHFTRIAMGDGLIGSGSMINRTALVHERHSLRIDGVVATDDAAQAAVIATLDNKDLTEGFLYRELALMAQDPDTGQEGAYLYDNAGQECEFLDTQNSGVVIYERMKLLIRTEQTDSITFDASGNPLNITWAELEGLLAKKADLGSDGKVVTAQIPDLFVVSGTEPEKGPVLWFDTSGGQAAANAMLELAEDSGAYFNSFLHSLPGRMIVRTFPFNLMTVWPCFTASTVIYLISETRMAVEQRVSITMASRSSPLL